MEPEILKDKQILQIQKQNQNLVERAQNFLVNSDESLQDATGVIDWLSERIKSIEERRKFYGAPYGDIVKKINNFAADLAKDFKASDEIMRKKVLAYRKELEAKRLQEEEKTRLEAEKIAKKTKVPVAEIMASNPTEELNKSAGTGTFKKTWTFKVIDIKKVPEIYLEVNSVEVNKSIRGGTREIPGLEIYQEENYSRGGRFNG